jgi:PilZ domain
VSRVGDIALGGLFIRTPDPPPQQSLVKLVLSTGIGAVRARGVVRWVAPTEGMAIEFTAMNAGDRGRLNGLLRLLFERQKIATDRRV